MKNTFYITTNIWVATIAILISNVSGDLTTGIISCLVAASGNFYLFVRQEQTK